MRRALNTLVLQRSQPAIIFLRPVQMLTSHLEAMRWTSYGKPAALLKTLRTTYSTCAAPLVLPSRQGSMQEPACSGRICVSRGRQRIALAYQRHTAHLLRGPWAEPGLRRDVGHDAVAQPGLQRAGKFLWLQPRHRSLGPGYGLCIGWARGQCRMRAAVGEWVW